MQSKPNPERREALRLNLEVPVTTDFIDQFPLACQASPQVRTRDLSPDGAFLVGDFVCAAGSFLRLILDMGKTVVEAVGRVVRIETDGIAIAFDDLKVKFAQS